MMIKPWLLMDKQERLQRADDYTSLVASSIRGQPIDEFLLVSMKPPDSRLGAMLELWLYQQRTRKQ
jgi:hypothetical protein